MNLMMRPATILLLALGPSHACAPVAPHEASNGRSALADRPNVAAQHVTWKDYNGGPDSSKYVALDEITKANVDQLEVAWIYPTGDSNSYQFNPLVVDNVMYVLAKNNSLVALDATTGKEIWIHARLRGIARRGINYWESDDRRDRRLIFQMNNYLQAIDAQTGKSILTFGKDGLVDLREGLGRDPETLTRAQSNTPGRIFEDLILMGSATGEGYVSTPGHLRAYDVRTGKLVWTFHTIPQAGEFGYDSWPKDAWRYAGGANTWGEISIDTQRGIAYFPTGSPTYDFYGADRKGANLFANCLLALDARTGKRLWHFQTVHHDLWDYDNTAAPQLITVRREGKTIDAVAMATKQGFLFVFDRVTGDPVWPIEERAVPQSDMPGEEAWPTQPFPTAPPPYARQILTPDDITPYLLTPKERTAWKARIAQARTGLFTPLSTQETIAVPGAVGGANWGNTAANPHTGMVYVLSQEFPSFYKLSTEPPGFGGSARRGATRQRGRALYEQNCQACHGADREGTALAPSLTALEARLSVEDFRQVMRAGRGKMPAFSNLDDDALETLFEYLGDSDGPGGPGRPSAADGRDALTGPVVASGGAPGGQELRRGKTPFSREGPPYPEDIDVPAQRYYTGYGLSYPYIMSPPWSWIVAYNLNAGTIKWKRPLGTDLHAAAEGGKDTGVPRGSQRLGMIVTATGLVFAPAKDGKIRAYDADTGDVLWTADLPNGPEGIPAMYEVNGRQYLVVCATTPLTWGRQSPPRPGAPEEGAPRTKGGYVVFTLGTSKGESQ
jgi:quinoprotein glucose dehydrogenase